MWIFTHTVHAVLSKMFDNSVCNFPRYILLDLKKKPKTNINKHKQLKTVITYIMFIFSGGDFNNNYCYNLFRIIQYIVK